MRKYNYFDDDQDDINSLLNSFDAPKEVKKQEVEEQLKEIVTSKKEEKKTANKSIKRSESAVSHKTIDKEELLDAIKAFSKKSGEKIVTVAHAVKEINVGEELEKLSKNKKRNVTIALVFVFLLVFAIMILATLHSVNSENKRIAKFDADAGKVCSQHITKYGNCSYENLYSQYGVTGYRMSGLCYAREMDFNNDNTSELLLCYDEGGVYYTEVWGYNGDNEFAELYHEPSTQTKKKSDDAWITIYSKNNKYYIGNHSGDELEKVELYGLKGDSFEKKYNAEYDMASEAFTINKSVDPTSFERIKLAVLVEEKAAVTTERVSKTIESFLGTGGTSKLLTNSQNIQNAYYSIVEEHNQTYGKAKLVKKNGIAYIDGLAAVDLIDFDGNDTPELVLVYRKSVNVRDSDASGNYISKIEDKYYIEIYRYNGTKAVLAYKNESISNRLGDTVDMYYIIKNKNNKAYYCANAFSTQEYGKVINASSTVFKFDGTKFTQQTKAIYRTRYGYTSYYIDDSEVSKSTFNDKGFAVPLFKNDDDSYDENTYTVTFLQRKQLKSNGLNKRVDETVTTIRKLHPSYSGDTE